LVVWFVGALELPHKYGVRIAPALTLGWVYSNVVIGGLWGLLFMLPYLSKHYMLRGALYSLAPSAVTLFLIYPIILKKGLMGYHIGEKTYLFVLLAQLVWGLASAAWLRFLRA
jgi:hypothetical protein